MLPVLASRRNLAGRAMELVVYSAAVSSGSVKFFLIITGLALVLGEYNKALHPSTSIGHQDLLGIGDGRVSDRRPAPRP
jgi:hypothetical protein